MGSVVYWPPGYRAIVRLGGSRNGPFWGGPKMCTFRTVFNNSPIRDREFGAFFWYFPTFPRYPYVLQSSVHVESSQNSSKSDLSGGSQKRVPENQDSGGPGATLHFGGPQNGPFSDPQKPVFWTFFHNISSFFDQFSVPGSTPCSWYSLQNL
jgi:hypothetical protein